MTSHQYASSSSPSTLTTTNDVDGMTFTPQGLHVSTPPLLALPFELLLKVHEFLTASAITRLHSTCSALYTQAHNEHIYALLCARYGVVDLASTPAPYNSYYAVYTRLLHAFGPLLGLWASDAPYRGQIIRIRFDSHSPEEEDDPGIPDPSSDGPGISIIGEVWTFPHNNAMSQLLRGGPRLLWDIGSPVPRSTFRISFDTFVPPLPEGVKPTLINVPHAGVHCTRARGIDHTAQLVLARCSVPRRQIAMHIHHEQDEPLLHPDFPPQDAPWIDVTREWHDVSPLTDTLPKVDRTFVRDRLAMLGREVYYDEFYAPKEDVEDRVEEVDAYAQRFLSIHCECFSPLQVHTSLLGPARFYPFLPDILEAPPRDAVIWAPRTGSSDADLASLMSTDEKTRSTLPALQPHLLGGIWIGDYGPHGAEVLHLRIKPPVLWPGETAHTQLPTLHAHKLTGDFHVPRGAETWNADFDAEIAKHELMGEVVTALCLDEPGSEGVRIFSGWATFSEAGFLSPDHMPCFVAVFDVDHILVWWSGMDHVNAYIRWREQMHNPLEDEVGDLPGYIAQVDQ